MKKPGSQLNAERFLRENYRILDGMNLETPIKPSLMSKMNHAAYAKAYHGHEPTITSNVAQHRRAIRRWLGKTISAIDASNMERKEIQQIFWEAYGSPPIFRSSEIAQTTLAHLPENRIKEFVERMGGRKKALKVLDEVIKKNAAIMKPLANEIEWIPETAHTDQAAHVMFHTFHGIRVISHELGKRISSLKP